MSAKNITELFVLKIVYVPPNAQFKFSKVVDFRTRVILPHIDPPIRDWYHYTMTREYLVIPESDTVEFREWRIGSRNDKLFTMKNIRYDNILLIIGKENIHWIFYKLNPIPMCIEGITPLMIKYSDCCFDQQYLEFIKSIKRNLDANGYLKIPQY